MKILLFDASATIQKVVQIIFSSDEVVCNPPLDNIGADYNLVLLDDKFVNLLPSLKQPIILMHGALAEKVEADVEYSIVKPFESKVLIDLAERAMNECTSALYENTFAFEPEPIVREIIATSEFKTQLEKIITEQIMLITTDIVKEKLSSKMILDKLESIVWEVVPDLAELEIKKQIGRLMPL